MRRPLAAFLVLFLVPALRAADAAHPVTRALDFAPGLVTPDGVAALTHAFRATSDPSIATSLAEFQRRFGAAGPHLHAGLQRAAQIVPLMAAAGYPNGLFPLARDGAARPGAADSLIDYAGIEAADAAQFESFGAAAKRILAGDTTTKRTPDATSRWLDDAADAILAAVRAAEAAAGASRGPGFDAAVTDLRIFAQLARFHARRAIGAVHYSLFKRQLRLAELYAATLIEREAVAAWRELVTIAGTRYDVDLMLGARPVNLCRVWRGELKNLEFGLKELEEQCCPPDEAMLKEKVWQPAPGPKPAQK